MEGTRKENETDYAVALLRQLLALEETMCKPVVITLLVERRRIDVLSCHDSKRYLDEPVHQSDEDEPQSRLNRHHAEVLSSKETYFG